MAPTEESSEPLGSQVQHSASYRTEARFMTHLCFSSPLHSLLPKHPLKSICCPRTHSCLWILLRCFCSYCRQQTLNCAGLYGHTLHILERHFGNTRNGTEPM